MDYLDEVRAHRARREAKIGGDDGWLTFVERLWLAPGDNAVPFGTLAVDGDTLALTVPDGLAVVRAGTPVHGRVAVHVGGDGDSSDVFEHDGRRYELTRRGAAYSVRVRDPRAAARLAFTGIPAFDIAPRWRIEARFAPSTPSWSEMTPLTDGEVEESTCVGVAHFVIDDVACALRLYDEPYSGRLFVPFGDATNGTTTYPAGRFLYCARSADDRAASRVVLDFNKAFNPPCAFNALVICPLPPAANRLPLPIPAGEQRPNHHDEELLDVR